MLDAGAATFSNGSFSPVSPKDFLRHSLLFNYLTVSVSGNLVQHQTGGQGNLRLTSENTLVLPQVQRT